MWEVVLKGSRGGHAGSYVGAVLQGFVAAIVIRPSLEWLRENLPHFESDLDPARDRVHSARGFAPGCHQPKLIRDHLPFSIPLQALVPYALMPLPATPVRSFLKRHMRSRWSSISYKPDYDPSDRLRIDSSLSDLSHQHLFPLPHLYFDTTYMLHKLCSLA